MVPFSLSLRVSEAAFVLQHRGTLLFPAPLVFPKFPHVPLGNRQDFQLV